MQARFRFTFEADWRHFPMAPWVHLPVADEPGSYQPPAPPRLAHKGYAVLRVEYGPHELVFSSPEQLQHCIDVLATKPLPTSRQLSARRGAGLGPNSHWLSRLPAELKASAPRAHLVRHLRAVQGMVLGTSPARRGKPQVQALWPGLAAGTEAAPATPPLPGSGEA